MKLSDMKQSREDLIDDLVADLKPVRRAGRIGYAAVAWLVAALVYSATLLFATGPIRPDAFANLAAYPLFGLETLVAMAAIVAFAFATLKLAIPGRGLPRRVLLAPLVLFTAWLAFYVAGLVEPAHPASMLGKREHCIWQGILFSLPNLFVLLLIARRFYPVAPRITAAAAGMAGGAIPAALMQFGCMYDPAHILSHHMAPILLSALLGAVAGPLVLRQRRTVPRSRGVPIH